MKLEIYNANGILRNQAALAGALGTTPVVTALPTSPTDGQLIYFQSATMAASGVVWTLRYNASSSSAYKWEYVGGAPMSSEIDTNQSTASTAYTDLATVGPTITLPLGGDFMIRFGCSPFHFTSPDSLWMGFSVNGGAASTAVDADAIVGSPNTGFIVTQSSMQRTRKKAGLTAADVTCRYKVNAGTGNFVFRWLEITPIRVG